MTYEENVHQVARHMAKEAYGYAFETSPPEVQEQDIDYCMAYARIAVRREAEAFKQGFNFGRTGYSEDQDKSNTEYWIVLNRLLIERGLIPAPGNCDGSGGCKDYGTIYINEVVLCKLCRRPINSPSNEQK
jgi:hypothetical protein